LKLKIIPKQGNKTFGSTAARLAQQTAGQQIPMAPYGTGTNISKSHRQER